MRRAPYDNRDLSRGLRSSSVACPLANSSGRFNEKHTNLGTGTSSEAIPLFLSVAVGYRPFSLP